MILASSNNASNQVSNQASNHNNYSRNQNNKAHKEEMSLRWNSTIQYHSDDKTNPAEAGFCLVSYV